MALADQAGVLAVEKLNTETLPLVKQELTTLLAPVLERLDKIVAESVAWRAVIERFNLSPPEKPQP